MKEVPKDYTKEVDVTKTTAWKQYQIVSNHPLLTTKRFFTASDGMTVDMGWLKHTLNKKINHLPKKEKEAIFKKKAIYYKLQCRAMWLKKSAYAEAKHNLEDNLGIKRTKTKYILDVKRAEILELFGRMYSVKEVHEIIVKDWKIPVNLFTVQEYRKAHAQLINQKIEEFKKDYSDIRLGVKKSRIEELVWLYNKRKGIYEVSNKGDDHKLLLSTIEQIRKEAEGDSLRINGKIEFNQEILIQQHIKMEVFKQLSLKQIILSRIAARLNKNPMVLQKSVVQSYYHKYLTSPNLSQEEEPEYPSDQTYNFDDIKNLAFQREQRLQAEEREGEATITNPQAVEDIKTQLINKLLGMSQNVNTKKNEIMFGK